MKPLQLAVRAWDGFSSRLRNLWLRTLGVQITGYVWTRRISVPRNWADIRIEGGAMLDDGVVLLCSGPHKTQKLVIGSGCYINRYTMFDASESIHVGRNCMVGPFTYITDHDHEHERSRPVREQGLSAAAVKIEDDVWIGAGACILKGVTIGRGAVIGAGAVVTKSVAPFEKVAGVPAKVIGCRT